MSRANTHGLTAERLREVLRYDAETGLFYWRVKASKNTVVGSRAGPKCKDGKGYPVIRIDKALHRAHRLAWLHVYGEWPSDQIDHINCVRADNRIANLRLANNAQNNANRPSYRTDGLKGVGWHTAQKKWRAYVTVGRKQIHLGTFDSQAAAATAYNAAARKHFGEFAREAAHG